LSAHETLIAAADGTNTHKHGRTRASENRKGRRTTYRHCLSSADFATVPVANNAAST